MPAMSDGANSPTYEPRVLRSKTRTESIEKSPTRRLISDASKTVKKFFSNESRGSKRRRSSATATSQKEAMSTNGVDSAPDVAEAFERGVQKSEPYRVQYAKDKKDLIQTEERHSWDHKATQTASKAERKANEIALKIREHERDNHFGNKASEAIPGPETLDMGGQFLTNKERIESSRLFQIAVDMPKGAHLHLHFNSEFPPEKLLRKVKEYVIDTMYVRSTQPLLDVHDLAETEMVFNVMPKETPSADLFSKEYNPASKNTTNNPWMKWTAFGKAFQAKFNNSSEYQKQYHTDVDPEKWVLTKMILDEDEVYGIRQTTNGIWARFNQGTRAFKGLMNYESIYRWYIQACINDMIEDRVMYAELRPMLLDKSIPTDDGKGQLSNAEQMRIIVEECQKKKEELEREGRLDQFPFGLKIIYCTPRSIPKERMKAELQDCIKLKLEFPDLICGFDLVGAEDRPNHIGYYKDELLAFVETCAALGLDLPFLFHAGETLLDRGGSRDPGNSNLYDSLLLKAKRIGHGFSLVKHPDLAAEFRKRPICIELCPTSNELLHLCRNIKEHPYPELLALGIPCTVNSDNPSLFSSSLSFEFYQVIVGSPTMNLHGWKQLALWSLDYACLKPEEIERAKEIFMKEWEAFCTRIIDAYGEYADGLDIEL